MFVAMVLSASAQYYMHVWSDGATYSMPVLNVDSVTFTDGPLENVPNEPQEPAQGVGVFSVGEGRTITFAHGNLQYTQSTDTWSFAENQWDYIGTDNVTGGSVSSSPTSGDSKSGDALADKIDLFGWSTSTTNFGVSTSTSSSDYSGSFIDWGTNKIGNDAPNTWRTLTYDEWCYLLNGRPNASSLRGVAQVNGVNGLIFLPDNWTCSAGITFKSGFHSSYGTEYYAAYQTFTADQWSKLEKSGAVFLPVAGRRNGASVRGVQNAGLYWSATECLSDYAYILLFSSAEASVDSSYRLSGLSVRLVKDVEGETTEPEIPEEDEEPETPTAGIGSFSVSASKQVTFSPGNLQYHPKNDEWRFAENQWDYVGEAGNNVIASDYNGWIDLFGWGTGNAPLKTSQDCNDYQSFVDWGTNKIGNDTANTWRTLCKDEWVYIFYHRPNAQSLFALGTVEGNEGVIVLPDNWEAPNGVDFVASNTQGLIWTDSHYENIGDYSDNTYTINEWLKMEYAGAVFLPAAGVREHGYANFSGYNGVYWTSSANGGEMAYHVHFNWDWLYPQSSYYNHNGNSVRLVKDVEGESAEPGIPPANSENGHEYVDLGLSVKWATCNVGATKPEEYGDYFAWGEVEPKEVYDWSTYKWGNSNETQTKYCTDSNYGTVDNKTVLESADDAATANWGGAWRMPTYEELDELLTKCTWIVATMNGVDGCKVIGPNGNSIFLPSAGYRQGGSSGGREGTYWSSSLYAASNYANEINSRSDGTAFWNFGPRCYGNSIRPVCH